MREAFELVDGTLPFNGEVVAESSDTIALRLGAGESLPLYGAFTLELVAGRVEVGGLTMQIGDQVRIVSPACSAAVVVICTRKKKASVLRVHRLQGHGLEQSMGRLCGPFHEETLGGVDWLRTTGKVGEVFPLNWREEITEALNISKTTRTMPRIVICGPRDSGKSTLFRFICNVALQQFKEVWAMDTDPGQPELGPPGSMSVGRVRGAQLGPGFCQVDSAVEIAMRVLMPGVSADADPNYFEHNVRRLAAAVPAGVVLVVNTSGWISGVGLDVLQSTLNVVEPTTVLQLHKAVTGELDSSVVPDAVPLVSCVQLDNVSPPQVLSNRAARELNLVIHLGAPMAARHSLPLDQVCLAIHNGDDIDNELLLHSVAYSIVGLVESPSHFVGGQGSCCTSELPNDGILLAHGFLETFENEGKVLIIQSRLSPEQLARVNVIVRAGHDLPASLLKMHGPYSKNAVSIGNLGRHQMTGRKPLLRGKDFNGR